jgi:hypothetical protein
MLVDADGRLFGQAFDPDAAALAGTPVLLAAGIAISGDNDAACLNSATVSREGVIAFVPEPPSPQSALSWFDRTGGLLDQAAAPGAGLNFDVSRDGRLAAVSAPSGPDRGVYVLDLTRGVRTRIARACRQE